MSDANKDFMHDLKLLLEADLVEEDDRVFAHSLVSQFDKQGDLSPKQWPWVEKLALRAITGTENIEMKLAGDLKQMLVLFEFAKNKLKYPKVRLQTPSGLPVVLSLAGPKAKKPGTINVTDGKAYGSNRWYGRISVDGVYQKGHMQYPELDEVVEVVNQFSADPQQAASAHGHLSGHCCFCGKALTDKKSVDVGYGPSCAKVYGLPHGPKKEQPKQMFMGSAHDHALEYNKGPHKWIHN